MKKNVGKKESTRRKVSINTTSDQEEKKQFQCEICNANFGRKGTLDRHVGTVHEGKKQFKCDICNGSFGQKAALKNHVATVHEVKK